MILAPEVPGRAGMGGRDQPPVPGGIGPGMVGAGDELARRALTRADLRPAMAAGIVPGTQGAIDQTHQDHACRADLHRPHRAGSKIGDPARADPVPRPERFHFAGVPVRRDIGLARQGFGAVVEQGGLRMGHQNLPGGVARLRAGWKNGRSVTVTGSIRRAYCSSRKA